MQNGQRAAAEYTLELVRGLSDIAKRAGLGALHYLLELAYAEAIQLTSNPTEADRGTSKQHPGGAADAAD